MVRLRSAPRLRARPAPDPACRRPGRRARRSPPPSRGAGSTWRRWPWRRRPAGGLPAAAIRRRGLHARAPDRGHPVRRRRLGRGGGGGDRGRVVLQQHLPDRGRRGDSTSTCPSSRTRPPVAAGFALFEDERRVALPGSRTPGTGPGRPPARRPRKRRWVRTPTRPLGPSPSEPSTRRSGSAGCWPASRSARSGPRRRPTGAGRGPGGHAGGRIEGGAGRAGAAGHRPRVAGPMLPLFAAWPWPGNSLEGHKDAEEFLGPGGRRPRSPPTTGAATPAFASVGSAPGAWSTTRPTSTSRSPTSPRRPPPGGAGRGGGAARSGTDGRPVAREEAPAPAVPGGRGAARSAPERPATGGADSLHLVGVRGRGRRGQAPRRGPVQVDAGDPAATPGRRRRWRSTWRRSRRTASGPAGRAARCACRRRWRRLPPRRRPRRDDRTRPCPGGRNALETG